MRWLGRRPVGYRPSAPTVRGVSSLALVLVLVVAGSLSGEELGPRALDAIHEQQVWAPPQTLAWWGNGSRLGVLREDGTLTFWDVGQGVPVWRRALAASDHFEKVLPGQWGTGDGLPVYFEPQPDVHELRVLDLAGRDWQAQTVRLEGHPLALATDLEASRVAVALDDGRVCHWLANEPNQQLCKEFERNQEIHGLALDASGRTLAVGTWNHVLVWDLTTDAELHLRDDIGIQRLTFSPTRRLLAIGTSTGRVHLWDLDANVRRPSLVAHPKAISTLAFDSTGGFLATGSEGIASLWDIKSEERIVSFEGHRSDVLALAFDPSGRLLASAEADGGVKIWSLLNGGLLRSYEPHALPVKAMAFGDEETLLTLVPARPTIHIWDLGSRVQTTRRELNFGPLRNEAVSALAVDSSKTRLALGTRSGVVAVWSMEGLFAAREPDFLAKIHSGDVNSIAFSPKGDLLATGSFDRTIRILQANNGSTVGVTQLQPEGSEMRPRQHASAVTALAWGPDGQLVSGDHNHNLRLWDTDSGQKTGEAWVDGAILSLGFSLDGTEIQGVTDRGAFRTEASELAPELTWEFAARPTTAALSPDGTRWALAPSRNGAVEVLGRSATEGSMVLQSVLFAGAEGSWVGCEPTGSCNREGGLDLLLEGTESGDLVHLTPELSEQADLDIEGLPAKLSLESGELRELEIEIHNRASVAAFGVRVGQQLPSSFLVDIGAIPVSIAPGERIQVPLRLGSPTGQESAGRYELKLTVRGSNTAPTSLPLVEVEVVAPKLVLESIDLDESGRSFKVAVRNGGSSALRELRIRCRHSTATESWVLEGGLSVLEPGTGHVFGLSLPADAAQSLNGSVDIEAWTVQFPLHSWTFRRPLADASLWPWLVSLFVLIAVVVGSYWTRKPPMDPLLERLFQSANHLKRLPIQLVPRAHRLLRETKRVETVTGLARVEKPWLALATEFAEAEGAEQRFRLLVQRLGLEGPEKPLNTEGNLWSVKTGPSFRLSLDKILFYFPSSNATASDALSYLHQSPDWNQGVVVVFSPKPDIQSDLDRLTDRRNHWVAPSNEEITTLLLDTKPLVRLAELISDRVPPTRISPYQVKGAVKKPNLFFGRDQLLASIVDHPSNYLLVGGRQVGKSSLLKEVERRFKKGGNLECHYHLLSDHEVLRRIADEIGIKKRTVDAVDVSRALRGKRHGGFVFLLDEADPFIRHDRQRGFPILKRLRSWSEEGYAHFVLAGFWELYDAAVLDYHSPIKNFGDTLRIGALEHEACRLLATQPMETMKIRYESDQLVERLITETGQRANLISIVCSLLIDRLQPGERRIRSEDLEETFLDPKVTGALTGFGALSTGDEVSNRLDRIVVYSTIDRDSFTQADIFDFLREAGKPIAPEVLERSLQRLELAFVLKRDGDCFEYQVPLFRRWIQRQNPADLLRQLLDFWRYEGSSAQELTEGAEVSETDETPQERPEPGATPEGD